MNPDAIPPSDPAVRAHANGPDTSLVPGSAPPPLPTARLVERAHANDPTAVYLARLAPGSRRHIASSLSVIVELLTGRALEPIGFPWEQLRYMHTGAIRARLVERYAPSSTNRHLAALRGVLKEAWRLGLMSADDYARAADVASVSAIVLPAGRRLELGELRTLFDGCGSATPALGARDAALLALLYGAGLRRAEAVGVALEDLDGETGEVKVRHGKRRKQRLVYLSAGGRAAIEAWLRFRGDGLGPLLRAVGKGGAVRERPLPSESVYRIVQAAARRSSVKEFSPHDLRRTFVSGLLDAGADLSVVKEMAGHASISTTVRYDLRGERAKQKASELLHIPYVAKAQ